MVLELEQRGLVWAYWNVKAHPSDVPPLAKSPLRILPKQFHQLPTKYSNIGACAEHTHSNYLILLPSTHGHVVIS